MTVGTGVGVIVADGVSVLVGVRVGVADGVGVLAVKVTVSVGPEPNTALHGLVVPEHVEELRLP